MPLRTPGDDHARNHACFWDGECLDLTPAYDICPQPRTGMSANQAMAVGKWGRQSSLQNAVSECERFGLGRDEAEAIAEEMTTTVRNNWVEVFADSGVPEGDRQYLSRATMLSESVFYELD